jgi:hypothetical protein
MTLPPPRSLVPISIASITGEMNILPSPGDPVLATSNIVLIILSTSESSTTVIMVDRTENSDTNLEVPLPDSTIGFSPLPRPLASRTVHPPTPAAFNASFTARTFSLAIMASIRFIVCYKKISRYKVFKQYLELNKYNHGNKFNEIIINK